ncbi:MAG: hypothetical protein NTY38_09675, partial [Acidobacteria bacterium]|nr:hypothetical protein [Acidobacteriota bacterium]
RHGEPGSHDEVLLYYGSVIRIGDTFHMWYTGNNGPLLNHIGYELTNCALCYASSKDGVHWEKPALGLVDYKGSKRNNICELDQPTLWSTAAVLHDPEDPDPNLRFKIAYEARFQGALQFCVAYSADGFRWKKSPRNPVAPFLEMAGITRFRGLYYVNGQPAFSAHGPNKVRRLATYVSEDFEYWSPCPALGLDRSTDLTGPSRDADANQEEEIHLGAALWNRGNVLVGIYGQWHGHPSGDRRWVVMDLGLALSHDALHFREPVPGFRIIPAREQPEGARGIAPALMQGQGMENFGDRTLYWYSPWRGTENSGVRMVSWQRDRLGLLKPFLPRAPRAVSCPIRVARGPARLFVNAGGLGKNSQLRVSLLREGFRPIPGFSDGEGAIVGNSGLRLPVRWGSRDVLPEGVFRVDIRFEGARPEDAGLYAVYVTGEEA